MNDYTDTDKTKSKKEMDDQAISELDHEIVSSSCLQQEYHVIDDTKSSEYNCDNGDDESFYSVQSFPSSSSVSTWNDPVDSPAILNDEADKTYAENNNTSNNSDGNDYEEVEIEEEIIVYSVDNVNDNISETKKKHDIITQQHDVYEEKDDDWKVINKTCSDTKETNNQEPVIINFITFNQEKNCIAMATNLDFHVFQLSLRERKDNDSMIQKRVRHVVKPNGVLLCQMLYSTSLLALVKSYSPRTLSLVSNQSSKTVDTQQSEPYTMNTEPKSLTNIHFGTAVKYVEISDLYIFVLTSDGNLHIFDLRNSLKKVNNDIITQHTHHDKPVKQKSKHKHFMVSSERELRRCYTHSNESEKKNQYLLDGAFFVQSGSISSHDNNNISIKLQKPEDQQHWLVCKSSDPNEVGTVFLYDISPTNNITSSRIKDGDVIKLSSKKVHKSDITRLSLSLVSSSSSSPLKKNKHILATASQKGTLIRIFSLPDFNQLYSLWRGNQRCLIYSIAFSSPLSSSSSSKESNDCNINCLRGSKKLVVGISASTGTVHLYRLDCDEILSNKKKDITPADDDTVSSSISSILSPATRAREYLLPYTTTTNQSMNNIDDAQNKLSKQNNSVSHIQTIQSFCRIKLKLQTTDGVASTTPTTLNIQNSDDECDGTNNNADVDCLLHILTKRATLHEYEIRVKRKKSTDIGYYTAHYTNTQNLLLDCV